MSYKESDWKLFKKLIPIWQERYMTKLNKEYIGILIRYNPGVVIEMSRSLLVENLVSLIKYNVISFDEIIDFSDEIKESIQMWLNI